MTYRRAQAKLEEEPLDFRGRLPTDHNRYPAPNGGLFSTAPDYARFCRMILNQGTLDGNRYLNPDSVKLMTSVQTGDLKTGFTPGNGWGLGWCVVRQPQGITAMLPETIFGTLRMYSQRQAKRHSCCATERKSHSSGDGSQFVFGVFGFIGVSYGFTQYSCRVPGPSV
jgi:CubicO group peptidase (beta-lactamase class C family)